MVAARERNSPRTSAWRETGTRTSYEPAPCSGKAVPPRTDSIRRESDEFDPRSRLSSRTTARIGHSSARSELAGAASHQLAHSPAASGDSSRPSDPGRSRRRRGTAARVVERRILLSRHAVRSRRLESKIALEVMHYAHPEADLALIERPFHRVSVSGQCFSTRSNNPENMGHSSTTCCRASITRNWA